jgi:proteasome accessory factor B
VSRKTERLVNLTIALLATKRYLTKSEIFRTVDGYEGTPESKERMFERDKDDLRNLGIVIEVGTFDPLFEDESGYRIKPENYQFQLGELDSKDIALLSLAAEAWRGAALDSSALSALVKLHAIGIETDAEAVPDLAPSIISKDVNLAVAISGITSRTVISFSYLSEDLKEDSRAIEPYAVASRYGHWYLFGMDLDRKDLRSFRLDRIQGAIATKGRAGSYEIPQSFSVENHLLESRSQQRAELYLRSGRALALRTRSTEISDGKAPLGWERVAIEYRDQERMAEEILWYAEDVVVLNPESLRRSIIQCLQSGVARYG